MHLVRVRVLDRIGENLRDREVYGRLHRGRRAAVQVDVQRRGDRGVQRKRLDRVAQAAFNQYGRVDAADQAAQVRQRSGRILPGLSDQAHRGIRVAPDQALHRAQGHANRHQPSLGAVVQVALDPPQFGGGGVDGVDSGRGQRPHTSGQLAVTAHDAGVHADGPRDQPAAEQQQRDSGGDLEASQDGPLAALPGGTGIRRRAEPFNLIKRRSQDLPDGDRDLVDGGGVALRERR